MCFALRLPEGNQCFRFSEVLVLIIVKNLRLTTRNVLEAFCRTISELNTCMVLNVACGSRADPHIQPGIFMVVRLIVAYEIYSDRKAL